MAGAALAFTATAGPVAAQAQAQAQAPAAVPAAAPDRFDAIIAPEIELGSDDWRAQKLARSSRRNQMISITRGTKKLEAFVVYPDKLDKAPVVLMVPEDQGLNNWAKSQADEIAAMGYVVVVADMLSGLGPNGGGRGTFRDLRSVFVAHSNLSQTANPEMVADLNAWADYAKKLPQFNGKLAGLGFAWGGGRILRFAAQRKDLTAVFVFYDGAAPEVMSAISAPFYGFYAADDARVTRMWGTSQEAMNKAGKRFEARIYPGSEHMFVRLGDEPRNKNPDNVAARSAALSRLQELLRGM